MNRIMEKMNLSMGIGLSKYSKFYITYRRKVFLLYPNSIAKILNCISRLQFMVDDLVSNFGYKQRKVISYQSNRTISPKSIRIRFI